ncbi:hypothetical protein INR49_027534 [Caranx melampygus]|nr:hypothetical protein INR49_027534 [Caranx melampygus]
MALWILGAALLARAAGFYLPGLAPVSFCERGKDQVPDCKSAIELFVNRLDSVESVLPYEYTAFDFCSAKTLKRPSENLGQVLFGERIEPSPYKFEFKKPAVCQKVCTRTYDTSNPTDKAKLDFLKKGMLLNYQHHWIVDNMPVTWCYDVEDGQKFCNPGFPIGCYVTEGGRPKDACVSNFNEKDAFYVFNHVDITIYYHIVEHEQLGARLHHELVGDSVVLVWDGGNDNAEDSAQRHRQIQSNGLCGGRPGGVWVEVGPWRCFRPPRKGMLLSSLPVLGFLSPANRGALMTCAVVLWVLLGTPAGYVAARLYKSFGGEKWKTNVLLTAFLCPGVVFADFFVMNLILWGEGSSAACPLGPWWPYWLFGSGIEHPVRTNQIPRQIPEQSFYTKPFPGIVMGGILPFGCPIKCIICSAPLPGLHHPGLHWQWRSFLTSGFTAVYFLVYAIHYFFSKLHNHRNGQHHPVLWIHPIMALILPIHWYVNEKGICLMHIATQLISRFQARGGKFSVRI